VVLINNFENSNLENSYGINDLSVDMCDLYTVIFKLWCFSNFGVFQTLVFSAEGGGVQDTEPRGNTCVGK
jgi:hypothetical protein